MRFTFGSIKEKRILELMHSYVFELVLVPSLGKFVYYVSFIERTHGFIFSIRILVQGSGY